MMKYREQVKISFASGVHCCFIFVLNFMDFYSNCSESNFTIMTVYSFTDSSCKRAVLAAGIFLANPELDETTSLEKA